MPARKPKGPPDGTSASAPASPGLAEARELFPHVQVAPLKTGRDPFSESKKRAFLLAVAQCGQVNKATQLVGVSHHTPYVWLKRDPTFREALNEAKAMACHALEDEAMRRALDGVTKGIWYKGERVGEEQEYSDVLTIFLLKGAMPEKYRERVTTTHDVSEHLQALQQQWTALREANVSPNALPEGREVIDVTPPTEDVAPRRTDRIFEMLDAVNRWSRERADEEADGDEADIDA